MKSAKDYRVLYLLWFFPCSNLFTYGYTAHIDGPDAKRSMQHLKGYPEQELHYDITYKVTPV